MNSSSYNESSKEKELDFFSQDIAPGEIIIGTLSGFDNEGNGLVDYSKNPSSKPIVAITTVALNQHQSGRQVALLFAEGNPNKPVIMGLIHSPLQDLIENFEIAVDENEIVNADMDSSTDSLKLDDVHIDGKRITLEGKDEVVLKCGAASITLTKAGKILIKGKYLLNRSTGVNRIMGGSVQVN